LVALTENHLFLFIQGWRINPGGAGLLRGEGIVPPPEELVTGLQLDPQGPGNGTKI